MAERNRRTVRDLRRGNRARVLQRLYFDGPLSRQELGPVTGLSSGSISNVVAELSAEGLLEEAGIVDSDGGRPRTLLRVAPDGGLLVGIDIGETRVRVELFDLSLTELARTERLLAQHGYDVDRIVAHVRTGVADVLRDAGADPRRLPRHRHRSARHHRARRAGRARRHAQRGGARPDHRLACGPLRAAAARGGRRAARGAALHRQRRQDAGSGRDVVRRRPGRGRRRHRPHRLGRRRLRRPRRHPRRGPHQPRPRMGPHHRPVARPHGAAAAPSAAWRRTRARRPCASAGARRADRCPRTPTTRPRWRPCSPPPTRHAGAPPRTRWPSRCSTRRPNVSARPSPT